MTQRLYNSRKLRFRSPGLLVGLCLLALFNVSAVRADEAQERFDAALAAIEADEVYKARELLQELLADYPTLNRARLELARVNYYARDYEAAEAEVEQVLEDPDVPASVRPTLLAFLAQIREDKQGFEKRHSFGSYVYGGVMYDTNANLGTNDVIIGNTPFALQDSESDWATVLDGGVSHSYNPNKTFTANGATGYFLWQSQLTGYYRNYHNENEFNLGVITARTGPVWAVADRWRLSLAVQGDQIWFGSDRLAFFTSLNPTFSWILDERTEITFDGFWQNRDYNDREDEGRDGELWSGAVILSRFYLERDLGLQAGVTYTDFDADDDPFGYKLPEIFVGATYEAWNRGTIYGRAGYRYYDYDDNFDPVRDALEDAGKDPGKREDDEYRVIVGFRHQLAGDVLPGWVIRGEYVWTDSNSDVDVFDYDRTQVSLGLSRGF